MAPRANWKGFLKLAEVICPIALYTAASTSERIAFHTLNRATGHRVRRQFVDSETGAPVDASHQVKGYETSKGEFVVLEPEEIAVAVPASDKTLTVHAFIRCDEIDEVYFDKPYYLAPAEKQGAETFSLIREGLRKTKVAAIGEIVLFRRVHSLLIRPDGKGLVGTSLKFDYEVRSAKDAFDNLSATKIKGEMLELAEHIIKTKEGAFDPAKFGDRYEAAVAELVKAKLEGRAIEAPKRPSGEKVVDLMAALRESAGMGGKKSPSAGRAAKSAPARKRASAPRRKAG